MGKWAISNKPTASHRFMHASKEGRRHRTASCSHHLVIGPFHLVGRLFGSRIVGVAFRRGGFFQASCQTQWSPAFKRQVALSISQLETAAKRLLAKLQRSSHSYRETILITTALLQCSPQRLLLLSSRKTQTKFSRRSRTWRSWSPRRSVRWH